MRSVLEELQSGDHVTKEEYHRLQVVINEPIQGNGRAKRAHSQGAAGGFEQETSGSQCLEKDCLFGAVALAQQRSVHALAEAFDLETLAGEVKAQAQIHLIQIVKKKANEQTTTEVASVDPRSLLGRLITRLSVEELRIYAEFMNPMQNNTTIPAGALDICVLSHMMRWEFQVYRQIAVMTRDGLSEYGICLDTGSGYSKTVKLLYHDNHYTLLPEALPLDFRICDTPRVWIFEATHDNGQTAGDKSDFSTSSLNQEERGSLQTRKRTENKVGIAMCDVSRVDNTQNNPWETVLSISSTSGIMGFLELQCVAVINRHWRSLAKHAMRLLPALTFQASSSLTENRGEFPMAYTLLVIQACGSDNVCRIDMINREIRNTSPRIFIRKIIRTIREKCPNMNTIDLTDCPDQSIIQTLSTLM
jgi:hypothetical protein